MCFIIYIYRSGFSRICVCVCKNVCGGCKYFMRESWVRKDPHLLLLVKVEMFK